MKYTILTKILSEVREVTLCNREIEIEYEGFEYIIKFEPIIFKSWFFQIQKYIWLIYLKKYNKTKNADIIKLIAFSNQKYDWNPELMEKDAFQCIQNIGKELNN